MLKGLIEYLIYLLFSSGRDVFIQVEKVYQDIPFFRAQDDLKGIETLSVFLLSAASRLPVYDSTHPSPLLYLNDALYYLNAWNKLSRLSPT